MTPSRGWLAVALLVFAALIVFLVRRAELDRAAPPRRTSAAEREAAPDEQDRADTSARGPGSNGAGEAEDADRATLEGVLFSRYGPIWGVRVIAQDGDSGEVVGECYTDSEGRYRFGFDEGITVLLRIEPDEATGIEPRTERPIDLAPGDQRTHDVVLEKGLTIRGRLRIPEQPERPGGIEIGPAEPVAPPDRGDGIDIRYRPIPVPVQGMRVVAIPFDASVGLAGLHPYHLGNRHRESARVKGDGSFELSGLAEGPYRLLLDNDNWMLERVVVAQAGETDVELRAVPVLSVCAFVVDLATHEFVPAFRACLHAGPTVIVGPLRGGNGILVHRQRRPDPWPGDDPDKSVQLRIEADGYETAEVDFPLSRGQFVYLHRRVEPSVALEVRYEDGSPFAGELTCRLRHAVMGASTEIELERGESGEFLARVPPGEWELRVSVADAPFDIESDLELTVGEGGLWRHALTIPKGGSLTVHYEAATPHEGQPACRVSIYGDRGWKLPEQSQPDRFRPTHHTGAYYFEPGESRSFAYLPPRRYRIEARASPFDASVEEWTREIVIEPGGDVTVVIPAFGN